MLEAERARAMLTRLSLRARLLLGVFVARGGRARRRGRRHLLVAALVPARPHRHDARRRHAAGRCGRPARRSGGERAAAAPGHAGAGAGRLVPARTRVVATFCGRSFLVGGERRRAEPARDDSSRRRARRPADGGRPSTSPSRRRSGGGSYRVRASIEPGDRAGCSCSPPSLTGRRPRRCTGCSLIELVATALVLAAIAGLGLWVVRLGLRPLDAIGQTAAAIAAGDLSQRVERAEERTEVGRLGLALNAMLEPDRVVVPRAGGVGAQAPALRRRRLARAAHAARGGARLRGALRPRRGERARRPRALDEGDHPRVRADERARRRSAPARAPRRGPAARARAGRAGRGRRRRRSRPRRPLDPDRADRAPRSSRRPCSATATGSGRSSTTCSRTSARTRRRDARCRLGHAPGTASAEISRRRLAGPGSTRSSSSSVFERFYRADPSRARASGGVGLGLAIVAAVAEAHGGTASASSRPGERAPPSRSRFRSARGRGLSSRRGAPASRFTARLAQRLPQARVVPWNETPP